MTDQNDPQYLEAVCTQAQELALQGVSDADLRKQLQEHGFKEEGIALVLGSLEKVRRQQKQEVGKKHMVFGALWIIAGSIATAVTFGGTSGKSTSIVAIIALLIGIGEFLLGRHLYRKMQS